MVVVIPPLPAHGSTDWDSGWAGGLDAAVRELQTTVAALTAPTGLVFSVAGVTPDPTTGDVPLGAADVNATAAGYAPSFGDIPIGTVINVDKDPVTGFWPTGYNADGSPIYTGGSASHGTRPHARFTKVVWRGAEPSPDTVSSGTGGMLRANSSFGGDERAIPNP